jgi:hypothetical protein
VIPVPSETMNTEGGIGERGEREWAGALKSIRFPLRAD